MITIGQVGVGLWGQNLLRNFYNLRGCRIRMCCDKNKEVLERIKSQYGGNIKITDDFDDLIRDSQIDAVVIATLPITHAKFALRALSSGRHVFVEKPLALNVADAKEMIRAAKRNRRILMVGHLLLYHPAIKVLKNYIDDGLLGKVQYLYSTRVNLGQVREEENALWSLTAHDISVAIYLLDEVPLEVSATGKSYIRKEVQDVVFVTLNFKNKIMAHIHASWLDPHKIRKFTVVGSKKMAVFDDMESAEKLRVYDKGFDWQKKNAYGSYETFLTVREGDINIPKIDMVEPLKLECQHFIDSVKNNTQPFSDGVNGLYVLKILTAAQESLEANGKPVKVK